MLTCRTYVCFCALNVSSTHLSCCRLILPPVLEFVPHRWFSPLCFHKIGVRIFPGAWRTRENCKIAPRGDLVVCILSCCLKNEVRRVSEERKDGFLFNKCIKNDEKGSLTCVNPAKVKIIQPNRKKWHVWETSYFIIVYTRKKVILARLCKNFRVRVRAQHFLSNKSRGKYYLCSTVDFCPRLDVQIFSVTRLSGLYHLLV